jgi:aminoglycoside phosphotransferase (APT) family kinase protein
MRVDALLDRIADHLSVEVVSRLAGGEFGALLVRDRDGGELVLKALPSEEFADRFARGASLAMRLRSRGYPAPEYVGTGVALGATWSLQERMRGDIPEPPSTKHIRRLVELAEMHADAAGDRGDPCAAGLENLERLWPNIASHEKTHELADEIRNAVRACDGVELRQSDVTHGDFHHRNFLALGDDVTCVFDWEFAAPGDWRADLVTLAFWCAVLRDYLIPGDAGRIAIERAEELCPSPVLAFLAATMAARQLDFDVREHPERLEMITSSIERHVAPWWRAVLR